MNTSSFIFPKLLRPLHGTFGMTESPDQTTREIVIGQPSRKRKFDDCSNPSLEPNKRLATAADEEDVVFIGSVQTTPEPDHDHINRPRPGENWNDHCWHSDTVR